MGTPIIPSDHMKKPVPITFFLQGQVVAKRHLLDRPGVPEGIKEFYFNLQGFNQYGLLHDDVLKTTDIVAEAIRRLPPQMQVHNLIPSKYTIKLYH